VKAVPGRKSDFNDAEWLAYLLRAELIKPSYIPDEKYQELRTLTRLRRKLIETQTSFKNRVHKILQLCNIRLSSKIRDLFGVGGLTILDAIMNGRDIDNAIDSCNRQIRVKKDEIKQSVMGTLSQTDLFELKICVDNIKLLEEQIKQIDDKLLSKIDPVLMAKLVKLLGVAPATAAEAIAEIAEASRFENEKRVAGLTGLAPSRYQSAGKDRKGHITKQGDIWLRTAMIEVALAAIRTRNGTNTNLKEFYNRIRARHGHKKAVVALARKMLCIALAHAFEKRALRSATGTDEKASQQEGIKQTEKVGHDTQASWICSCGSTTSTNALEAFMHHLAARAAVFLLSSAIKRVE
jgi:transposase